MDKLLYGVAYYDEYMPVERLDKDIQMMKEAGINVVRIAESTWSTLEPQNGIFDFASIDRVLAAMHEAGMKVIIGTPTYAVPAWMVKKHPDIMAVTPNGQYKYGHRQTMDITNPDYLFYAERVIRRLLEHVCGHPAVIGYQADNETKHYNTSGPNVQALFVKYVRDKYKELDAINQKWGLDYWSNRISSWDEFPSADGTVNASFGCEFAGFQRKLVTDFLAWQVSLINEYKRPDQFVTHNFDFDFSKGYSCGIQPDVDHFAASKPFDIAGVDIYHPSQDKLTGAEISFCGDVARSMKHGNYLVIETEAQGFANWLPYPGQFRLQAFSHLASGADMVAYWHWHSIHNSAETYWKGLLSHDFMPNPTYEEAKTIGRDFERLSSHLVNLGKKNKAAVLFSNASLSAMSWFKLPGGVSYNDMVRLLYDALYEMNIGCDFVDPSSENIEDYAILIVPALYAAPDCLLQRLNRFVHNGGHIVYTFRSGFSDENVKVRNTCQPGIIAEACGINYSQFTAGERVPLKGDPFEAGKDHNHVSCWMELISAVGARVLAEYDHPYWGKYAAVTQNNYGKGVATYIGCMPSKILMEKVLEQALKTAGLWGVDQDLHFPLITKSGTNRLGNVVHYYLNYSDCRHSFIYPHKNGIELLENRAVASEQEVEIEPWGVKIIEEKRN